MIRTGFFGGSFNPIHNGHIAIAKQLLAGAALDEIWFVVSPQNPFKQNDVLLDNEKRLKLTRLALANEQRLIASDYEFRLPKPSYTWLTLQSLSRDHPERQFVLLIGGDNWAAFDRWAHYEEILDKYEIIVYPREGETLPAINHPHVTYLQLDLIPISSTLIRSRLQQGKSISGLVPAPVERMILAENLYK